MNILDTRDLIERRDELKQEILDSFLETFEHYADDTDSYEDIRFDEEELESWKSDWEDEIEEIEEIDSLEDEIGGEFEYGEAMIDTDDWEYYVRDLLEDTGDVPRDFPSWIVIDWEATASNVSQDYNIVTYQGTDYYVRAYKRHLRHDN